VHQASHLLEVDAMIHRPSSGMAQFMHQYIEHPQGVIQHRADQNLKGLISRGGVCPAFTNGPTALGVGREAASDPNVRWERRTHCIEEGAQFTHGG
jgi:hypothetical protein